MHRLCKKYANLHASLPNAAMQFLIMIPREDDFIHREVHLRNSSQIGMLSKKCRLKTQRAKSLSA